MSPQLHESWMEAQSRQQVMTSAFNQAKEATQKGSVMLAC